MQIRACASVLVSLGLCLLSACSDDSSRVGDAGHDAGGGVKDSGPLLVADAGNSADGNGIIRMCAQPRQELPAQALPRCTATTRKCVEGCDGATDEGTCRDQCVADDTHDALAGAPGLDCNTCVQVQLFACADQQGCHNETADTFCCLEDKCPTGSAGNCANTMCNAELSALTNCIGTTAPQCVSFTGASISACFDQGDGDGGTEDAGQ